MGLSFRAETYAQGVRTRSTPVDEDQSALRGGVNNVLYDESACRELLFGTSGTPAMRESKPRTLSIITSTVSTTHAGTALKVISPQGLESRYAVCRGCPKKSLRRLSAAPRCRRLAGAQPAVALRMPGVPVSRLLDKDQNRRLQVC